MNNYTVNTDMSKFASKMDTTFNTRITGKIDAEAYELDLSKCEINVHSTNKYGSAVYFVGARIRINNVYITRSFKTNSKATADAINNKLIEAKKNNIKTIFVTNTYKEDTHKANFSNSQTYCFKTWEGNFFFAI